MTSANDSAAAAEVEPQDVKPLAAVKVLARERNLRYLIGVRISSQGGDGLFEVGLAALFFFSPERASTTAGVALAFAVMLLPFTLIGPWAGVLLDLWQRRSVLIWANILRAGLVVIIAGLVATGTYGPLLYVLALICLSLNRFIIAALSASLPRVTPRHLLLVANSIVPTMGGVATLVGAAIAVVVRVLAPGSRIGDGMILMLSALAVLTGAFLASRIPKSQLGPDSTAQLSHVRAQLVVLLKGMVSGAKYLVARRTPAAGLAVMTVHRFIYGITFVAAILISRNLLADPADADAGLAIFGAVLGATGVGYTMSAVITPFMQRFISPHQWISVCLAIAAVSQLLITFMITIWSVVTCAVLLGLAAQGAKIAVDTIVQRDTADSHRGRAFSFFDVLFNAAFVGAAAVSIALLPDTGASTPVFAGLAVTYLITSLVYLKSPTEPRPV